MNEHESLLQQKRRSAVDLHLMDPDLSLEAVAECVGMSRSFVEKAVDKHYRRMKSEAMTPYEKAFALLAFEDTIRLMRLPDDQVTTITIESRATRKTKEAA